MACNNSAIIYGIFGHLEITAVVDQLTPITLIISMSDLPPEKKLRMTELKMTETESPVLSADELNRFSRQNAALGIKSY